MSSRRCVLLGTTMWVGATLISGDVMAQAQQQTRAAAANDSQPAQVSDVVVTGSRIRRTTFDSAQPVQIIKAEDAALAGVIDTAEVLQESAAAGTSGQINNYFTGQVVIGGPGVNSLSLRGIGAERTLILLNGRRLGPAGASGVVGPVDLNVIHSSLIERYEILTDGASSIYGSDAIAGVVNIITKQNLDGGSFNFAVNCPFESDGDQYTLSAGYGKTFDRGISPFRPNISNANRFCSAIATPFDALNSSPIAIRANLSAPTSWIPRPKTINAPPSLPTSSPCMRSTAG